MPLACQIPDYGQFFISRKKIISWRESFAADIAEELNIEFRWQTY
jgi:hypothetical protein